MAQSPLHKEHLTEANELNEFYLFEMPSSYSSVEQEFEAAQKNVAVIDRSWIGRIEVAGADRLDLLHRLSTNNLLAGKPGQIISTVFTSDKGRIIDYVNVLVRDSTLWLLTSPTNEENFSKWIEKYTIMEDIHLNVVTQSTRMITLVGPKAKEFAESLGDISLKTDTFIEADLPPCKATILCRNEFQTDFVDFIVDGEVASESWKFLVSDGGEFGLTKMGTRAFEAFRITRGIPAIGSELSDAFNPYEAGLVHAISFTKGCYIGQEVIARLDTYQKVQKSMWGIIFDYSPHQLRAGANVLLNGEEIGVLTSVSNEEIRGKSVGIGILKKNAVHADDHVSVVSDGKTVQGVIRSIPIVL